MGVTIESRGVVTTPGDGFRVGVPASQGSSTVFDVSAITSNTTSSVGGVYTVSGTAALGVTLPDPSTVAGSDFIYRSLSPHAHYLSSSQVTQDSFSICSSTANGSKLTLPSVIGSSVSLKSDGKNYLIQGASGTFTLARASV